MRNEYSFHSREEKLGIIKRQLAGESSKAPGKEHDMSDKNSLNGKGRLTEAKKSATINKTDRRFIL